MSIWKHIKNFYWFPNSFCKILWKNFFSLSSGKLWNFFKNTEFVISHIITSQPIPQAEVFYISSVQSLSRIQLFVTPWITARQASLSINNSQGLLKLMSIESVMPSSHLILLSSSPPAPNPSQYQGLFQWVNSLYEAAKVLEFQLQHQSFQWTSRTDLL